MNSSLLVKIKPHLPSILICVALLASAAFLRLSFLASLQKDLGSLDFGGDPLHHYDIAKNIAHGRGPVTDFIFSYRFHHRKLPALTDVYPPGVHYVLAGFLSVFGDSYRSARIACLFFGSISGCVVYFFARQFLKQGLAFITGAIVVFNPVHLEHSTIVMTPVVASCIVWLLLIVFLRVHHRYFLKGVLSGLVHLCIPVLPSIFFGLLLTQWTALRSYSTTWRPLAKRMLTFGLGACLAILPWGIRTYRYFGKPFYSNLNFSILTHNWLGMNYDTNAPSLSAFLQSNGGFWPTVALYLKQFGLALKDAYLQSLPLSSPESAAFTVFNVCLLVLGIGTLLRRDISRGLLLLGFFLSLLFFMSMAAVSLNFAGHLHTRHFIPFIPFLALLWALGLDTIIRRAQRWGRTSNPLLYTFSGEGTFATLLGMVLLTFLTWTWVDRFRFWKDYDLAGKPQSPFTEIYAFHIFWNRQNPELAQAAEWIKANTAKNSVFMYGSTPQDFWGLTRRKVIIDPVYAGGSPNRAYEEVKFYHVAYLVFDSNKTIYARSPQPADLSSAYPGITLSPVWKNPSGSIIIYRVDN